MPKINKIQVQGNTYNIGSLYSPFSKMVRVDSSTPTLLEVGDSCVLYPITPTDGIDFSLGSPDGPYQNVPAGTVIQNTSYELKIKTGTGFAREYDVGPYYRCYYGSSTYTNSITHKDTGIGVNTVSISTTLYTFKPCLVCFLKKSI